MKFLIDTPDPVTVLGQQVSLLWIVIGAALVVFMQAGFALGETGFTQAKNAAHVVSTNFAIFGLGFIGFYLVGFAFSFGGFSYSAFGMEAAVGSPLIGSGDWIFLWKGGWALTGDAVTPAAIGFFLYMVAFMDTVATIPTGSMAERWKWSSFVLWGFFCGAIYYPIIAAWKNMELDVAWRRLRGFRRLRCRAPRRWCGSTNGSNCPWPTNRQVWRRRQTTHHCRTPRPNGNARNIHFVVRMVWL